MPFCRPEPLTSEIDSDGKVFVMPVEEAYRIRTGESGEETLQAHPGVADELPR